MITKIKGESVSTIYLNKFYSKSSQLSIIVQLVRSFRTYPDSNIHTQGIAIPINDFFTWHIHGYTEGGVTDIQWHCCLVSCKQPCLLHLADVQCRVRGPGYEARVNKSSTPK